MRIIAVDDERLSREAVAEAIRAAAPEATVHAFATAREALAFAGESPVDVAFLDIQMPEMSGLSLALQLKALHPAANIVFVTGHSQYMGDAFSMHASGYVAKPATAEDIRRELDNLRQPPAPHPGSGVYVQCFGSFAVYVQGSLLHFSRAKPKELLAYLAHKNGADISSAAVAAVLWEDKAYDRALRSQVQTVISQLMAVLRAAGAQDIIIRRWNSIALDKARVQCDYYDFLQGKPQALNAYTGEYLADYSWAEFTGAQLARRLERI